MTVSPRRSYPGGAPDAFCWSMLMILPFWTVIVTLRWTFPLPSNNVSARSVTGNSCVKAEQPNTRRTRKTLIDFNSVAPRITRVVDGQNHKELRSAVQPVSEGLCNENEGPLLIMSLARYRGIRAGADSCSEVRNLCDPLRDNR